MVEKAKLKKKKIWKALQWHTGCSSSLLQMYNKKHEGGIMALSAHFRRKPAGVSHRNLKINPH